jgi:dTDP-4-amino-4,6-dideoxygalactose transaminase
VIETRDRDGLLRFLVERGIEAKVHYPVPVHLQPAARGLGYGVGDFPVCERQAREILTLPAHQFLSDDEVDCMIASVRRFYGR